MTGRLKVTLHHTCNVYIVTDFYCACYYIHVVSPSSTRVMTYEATTTTLPVTPSKSSITPDSAG